MKVNLWEEQFWKGRSRDGNRTCYNWNCEMSSTLGVERSRLGIYLIDLNMKLDEINSGVNADGKRKWSKLGFCKYSYKELGRSRDCKWKGNVKFRRKSWLWRLGNQTAVPDANTEQMK